MDDYQKEQLDAVTMARQYLRSLTPPMRSDLHGLVKAYLDFRREVASFLHQGFGHVCTQHCYENKRSACCTKEGIITFFADTVINVLVSSEPQVDMLCKRLSTPHEGFKCVYLGTSGCLWQVKPIVCEMFLCDPAQKEVFSEDPQLEPQWTAFRQREKYFKWPDRPVLFDEIEKRFIAAGYTSPLMYLHNSPGLLRVKQRSEHYPR